MLLARWMFHQAAFRTEVKQQSQRQLQPQLTYRWAVLPRLPSRSCRPRYHQLHLLEAPRRHRKNSPKKQQTQPRRQLLQLLPWPLPRQFPRQFPVQLRRHRHQRRWKKEL